MRLISSPRGFLKNILLWIHVESCHYQMLSSFVTMNFWALQRICDEPAINTHDPATYSGASSCLRSWMNQSRFHSSGYVHSYWGLLDWEDSPQCLWWRIFSLQAGRSSPCFRFVLLSCCSGDIVLSMKTKEPQENFQLQCQSQILIFLISEANFPVPYNPFYSQFLQEFYYHRNCGWSSGCWHGQEVQEAAPSIT